MLSQKSEKGHGKNLIKDNKKKEPKINILTYELLAFILLFNASSLVLHQSFKSLFMNFYVKFGRLLLLFLLLVYLITPLRIGAFVGLCCICQNHLKRCCTSFSSTGVTPSLSRMSSFWTRSLLVWPQIHRSMRISATLSCWTCHLLVGQYSALYNMVGRITVL
jgi:hypothetical protein